MKGDRETYWQATGRHRLEACVRVRAYACCVEHAAGTADLGAAGLCAESNSRGRRADARSLCGSLLDAA